MTTFNVQGSIPDDFLQVHTLVKPKEPTPASSSNFIGTNETDHKSVEIERNHRYHNYYKQHYNNFYQNADSNIDDMKSNATSIPFDRGRSLIKNPYNSINNGLRIQSTRPIIEDNTINEDNIDISYDGYEDGTSTTILELTRPHNKNNNHTHTKPPPQAQNQQQSLSILRRKKICDIKIREFLAYIICAMLGALLLWIVFHVHTDHKEDLFNHSRNPALQKDNNYHHAQHHLTDTVGDNNIDIDKDVKLTMSANRENNYERKYKVKKETIVRSLNVLYYSQLPLSELQRLSAQEGTLGVSIYRLPEKKNTSAPISTFKRSQNKLIIEYDMLTYFEIDLDDGMIISNDYNCCCKTEKISFCGNSNAAVGANSNGGLIEQMKYFFSYVLVKEGSDSDDDNKGENESNDFNRWKLIIYLNDNLIEEKAIQCHFISTLFKKEEIKIIDESLSSITQNPYFDKKRKLFNIDKDDTYQNHNISSSLSLYEKTYQQYVKFIQGPFLMLLNYIHNTVVTVVYVDVFEYYKWDNEVT